jgi:DNA-binding CsgD family transcriptional regulator
MESKIRKFTMTAINTLVLVFTAGDLIADFGDGSSYLHLGTEIALLILSSFAIWLIWQENLKLSGHAKGLTSDLYSAQKDAARWRHETESLIGGLSQAIDSQFITWQLTSAQKDVGFFLLKGLSLKEAATIRGTSERTVRQQAQEIYLKSGVTGRAEFAAYFLEDLLAPKSTT